MAAIPGTMRKKIQEELVGLGGKRVRSTELPSSRVGIVCSSLSEDHQCFEGKLRSRARKTYLWVQHFTLSVCTPACLHQATVLCARKTKNGDILLDKHIAGDCSHCVYLRGGYKGGK